MYGCSPFLLYLLLINNNNSTSAASEQLFRTDSTATKMMKTSSNIVGAYWLPSVFGSLIRNICNKPDNVEVDPIKLTPADNPQQNMEKLLEHVRKFLSQMMNAFASAPLYAFSKLAK